MKPITLMAAIAIVATDATAAGKDHRARSRIPVIRKPAAIIAADAVEAGPRFLGVPVRWLQEGAMRCERGHVRRTVKSEPIIGPKGEHIGDGMRCAACGSHVWPTFPEDSEVKR